MPTKQVMIGGQILHGSDRMGQWITENIDGWDEAPAVRSEEAQRPNADGDYPMPSHYASRTPTLDGIMFAHNRGQALEAIKALNHAAQLNTETLSVTDFGSTQWAEARYAGLEYSWLRPSVFRWQLRLSCQDPYKYGKRRSPVAKPGEPTHVFQRGNATAWPVVTVTGSMPNGYLLKFGSVEVDVSEPVTASNPHIVDMKKRRLRVGGSWVYGSLQATKYPSIEPGPRKTFSIVPLDSGTGQAVATFYDTYI